MEGTSHCDHLNGFQPIDMESWWAERSISSMINEKSPPSLSKINSNENISEPLSPIVLNPLVDNFKLNEFCQIDNNNNNCSVDKVLLTKKKINYKLSYSTNKSIAASLANFNNFQLCLS